MRPQPQRPRLRDVAKELMDSSTVESSESEIDVLQTEECINVPVLSGSRRPVRGSLGAAAYDLGAAVSCSLPARTVTAVDLNLALSVPVGYYLQLTSRSGLATKGILTVAGTIDPDFTGPVQALLFNTTDREFKIKKGQRITSGLFLPVCTASFQDVAELKSSGRGNNGFGSTGE